MITAIIILVFLIIVFYILLNKRTSKGGSDRVDSVKPTIMVSINGGEYKQLKSTPRERANRNKKRERLEKRDERRKRHYKICLVLRYMVTYRQLIQSSNFYDYNKILSEHKSATEELRKSHIDDYSLAAAIRFCRMEYYYGTCDHQLTDDDINFVLNWRSNTIDAQDTLKNVLLSYKKYWDSVLASYVRPSARIKRLQYLIDNLEDVMEMPAVQENPNILQSVKELQDQYKTQLSGMTS